MRGGNIMEEKLHSGKYFVVTGGTQGLGRGIAHELAENGAEGIVICGRNINNGESVKNEILDKWCKCEFVKADLGKESDCRNVVKTCIEKFAHLDGLVNAAGITDRGSIEDTTVESWDNIFSINVRAPFILIKEAVKFMKEKAVHGSIVNIISDQAHGGYPFLTAYSSSKGALSVLTKNTANALKFDRIRVNGLLIGWMYTPHEHLVQIGMGKGENWLEETEKEQPFKRLLRPEDVAYAASFLLSRKAEMITGSLIDLNQHVIGGMD